MIADLPPHLIQAYLFAACGFALGVIVAILLQRNR